MMARYIDADHVIKKLDKLQPFAGNKAANAAINLAKDVVRNAPTLTPDDLRPVGKWKMWEDYYGSNVYKCSVCGVDWYMFDGTPRDNDFNYCPNCGAKMKGE